jgi:hypothetical protein
MLWRLQKACGLKGICKRGALPNKLSGPAVPPSKIQTEILQLLAAHRDPESSVA